MPLIANAMPAFGRPLTATEQGYFGRDAPSRVRPYLALWGNPGATPLVSLPEVAERLGLGAVALKDEGGRLGLGSFKALGGAYAVMVIVRRLLEERAGRPVPVRELLSDGARAFARTVTFCCATDGNHGRSVAAGARLLGCRSVIFIHAGVSQERAEAIGADEIVRVEGTYDRSVEEATRIAGERGWHLVSDTSWPGYEEIPSLVGQGYTVLADEALAQMGREGLGRPTHVFLQAGVGGFAGSVGGYLTEVLGRGRVKVVVVEPERAACLHESARRGERVEVPAGEPTIMAMLECYAPSLVAWRLLAKITDGFMTLTEDDAAGAVRMLAGRPGRPVIAGESGAAGLAGLLRVASDRRSREMLALGERSVALVVNTEFATDAASFEAIAGWHPASTAA